METWMITGVTGFLGPRVEVTLRQKGEVEVLPMTREELNFTDEEQVKRVLGMLHPDAVSYTHLETKEVEEIHWMWPDEIRRLYDGGQMVPSLGYFFSEIEGMSGEVRSR